MVKSLGKSQIFRCPFIFKENSADRRLPFQFSSLPRKTQEEASIAGEFTQAHTQNLACFWPKQAHLLKFSTQSSPLRGFDIYSQSRIVPPDWHRLLDGIASIVICSSRRQLNLLQDRPHRQNQSLELSLIRRQDFFTPGRDFQEGRNKSPGKIWDAFAWGFLPLSSLRLHLQLA